MMLNFSNTEFETCVGTSKQLPISNYPEIVFSGRSNVGKSSFINKLINRKSLARVSSKPGKTITINFYNSGGIRLVDMPGYGYAKVPFSEKVRWSELVEGYFNSNRNISLVIQIIDFRHTPSNQDMDMINYLNTREIPFVIVATKADKLNKSERELRRVKLKNELSKFGEIETVIFSAVTGEGIDEIKNVLNKKLSNNSLINY